MLARDSDNGSPAQVVCILGMHRSGTSCLAGCLERAGLHLGDVVTWAPHNKRGNRESLEIRALNDDVLSYSGGTWSCPPRALRWNGELEARRDQLIAAHQRYGRWGFKDPRTLLTLPFWVGGLADVQLVGTFRHPVDVAQSLFAREKMSSRDALSLWIAYNSVLLDSWEAQPFPLISFDLESTAYLEAVRGLLESLGFSARADVERGCGFYDPALRHHRNGDRRPPQGPAAALYARLVEIYELQRPA